MRDLSFQEALDDPDMPFRQFVHSCVDLWNRAVEMYEAAGNPNGPAEDAENLVSWALEQSQGFVWSGSTPDVLGFERRTT